VEIMLFCQAVFSRAIIIIIIIIIIPPEKHKVKEPQKTAILGTAHILRKVLM